MGSVTGLTQQDDSRVADRFQQPVVIVRVVGEWLDRIPQTRGSRALYGH